MEFAHPPPVHLPNANMSIPPPNMNMGGTPMGPPPINNTFNQKFDSRNGFNNTRPPFRPFLNLQRPLPGPLNTMTLEDFDGKRLRKSVMRKTVDYNSAIIVALENRIWQRDYRDRRALQPDVMYYPDMMPPPSYPDNPINCVTTRFVKTATNKMRCPIFCMAWTPEGRRLVTGASSGEFTLWNGLTFNFETILQAHDSPVRCMVWSHNDSWMVTGDHAGYVKYWQSNMNNVKMFQAHKEALRGISFSPFDSKFVTCSDDGTLRTWDFLRYQEEKILRGHGADVKCVHWHPQKSLIISGSKDNQQPIKLWDPKTGQSLATLHAHKSTVMDLKWNDNGNWLITASRDHLLKLFDLRNLGQEVQTFRGHKKEASSVAWHPTHEGLFCSGGSDGAIMFWHVGADKEVGVIEQAHDSIVWTLAWHPLGHILCSGSNDHTSKFWTRNRPGDLMRDKYNLNTLPAGISGLEDVDIDEPSVIPGMGPDDKVEFTLSSETPTTIPGLDIDITSISIEDKFKSKKVPYSKPIPRNFQAQWNETASSEDGTLSEVINQLVENTSGVIPLQKIAQNANALIIGGKLIAVQPGSKLEAAVAEGSKSLYEYIVSGHVPELNDVMDQIREEYKSLNPSYDEDNDDMQDLSESNHPPPLMETNPFVVNFTRKPFDSPNRFMDGRSDRFYDEESRLDQDMRQFNSFNFGNEHSDVDLRNVRNMDVDFRQRDQDMRGDGRMTDQDFREPFDEDQGFRGRYNDGDDQFDYDDDRNWNDNFGNSRSGSRNNNFQNYRQSNFGRSEGGRSFRQGDDENWSPPPNDYRNRNNRPRGSARGSQRTNSRGRSGSSRNKGSRNNILQRRGRY
ncbi:hypothetical protein PPYR_09579 [Photinus pyralis]|uniref:Uncharacterized protein n=1 Tax=Photinus pyralis TaxID=7054 RepID=A0A1Y1L263_PHOPY|nr:pre-mRNA 3' end processing protein WDR33 [Photinus pyralis]XP_031343918.1 pre-mRNA 3' end processing protein WDR33 [Photinus pyralis]KAB0798586.1 hypothetical protein PPYR_09579 [Photinus pyralis]